MSTQRGFPRERTIYHSDGAFHALPTALVAFSLDKVYVAQILSNVVCIQSPLVERKVRKRIIPFETTIGAERKHRSSVSIAPCFVLERLERMHALGCMDR